MQAKFDRKNRVWVFASTVLSLKKDVLMKLDKLGKRIRAESDHEDRRSLTGLELGRCPWCVRFAPVRAPSGSSGLFQRLPSDYRSYAMLQ